MAVYFLEWQEVFKCLFVILSLNFNLWKKEVSVDNNPLLFTITKSNSSNWFHHHWRKWANCKNWETKENWTAYLVKWFFCGEIWELSPFWANARHPSCRVSFSLPYLSFIYWYLRNVAFDDLHPTLVFTWHLLRHVLVFQLEKIRSCYHLSCSPWRVQ